LARMIFNAARTARIRFQSDDILVVAQKVVSKAEGRIAKLSAIKPSASARKLAAKSGRDPRLVEIILRESRRIVREHPVLIVETQHGFVCANAGVDHSNVPGDDVVTLLPADPDSSARALAMELQKLSKKRIAVVVSDTFGRPWRLGLTNVAIGAAGIPVLMDLRGTHDRNAKPLQATILAIADDLAAAAGLAMGKREGIPVVIIRGYKYRPTQEAAAKIIRPAREDLFR
jgi:coenzyme F420-0:L-glutamate ligase / coenzyme F420-1:gamma-L-glutamate ligase